MAARREGRISETSVCGSFSLSNCCAHRHRSVSGEEAGRHPWITTEPDVACDGGGACGPGESDDGHLQARYHAGGVAERDVLRAMITDVLRVMDGF